MGGSDAPHDRSQREVGGEGSGEDGLDGEGDAVEERVDVVPVVGTRGVARLRSLGRRRAPEFHTADGLDLDLPAVFFGPLLELGAVLVDVLFRLEENVGSAPAGGEVGGVEKALVGLLGFDLGLDLLEAPLDVVGVEVVDPPLDTSTPDDPTETGGLLVRGELARLLAERADERGEDGRPRILR